MRSEDEFWRKCSSCKTPIEFKAKYYVCSVSTCNALRTGYVFCSIPCFEKHLPGARHRDAGAVEKIAGLTPYLAEEVIAPQRKMATQTLSASASPKAPAVSKEILIVASKLKDYIRARSEMNTSAGVMEVLSDQVRKLCDDAIDRARHAGRKTIMDRDFEDND